MNFVVPPFSLSFCKRQLFEVDAQMLLVQKWNIETWILDAPRTTVSVFVKNIDDFLFFDFVICVTFFLCYQSYPFVLIV